MRKVHEHWLLSPCAWHIKCNIVPNCFQQIWIVWWRSRIHALVPIALFWFAFSINCVVRILLVPCGRSLLCHDVFAVMLHHSTALMDIYCINRHINTDADNSCLSIRKLIVNTVRFTQSHTRWVHQRLMNLLQEAIRSTCACLSNKIIQLLCLFKKLTLNY